MKTREEYIRDAMKLGFDYQTSLVEYEQLQDVDDKAHQQDLFNQMMYVHEMD